MESKVQNGKRGWQQEVRLAKAGEFNKKVTHLR